MKARRRKLQIYARYRLRGRCWLTAEDRAWLNMVPIGREFGSKDYERLEILDAFTQGRIDARNAMSLLGIDRNALAAMVEKDGLAASQFADDVETLAALECSQDTGATDASSAGCRAREFPKKEPP